jgi:hypothetical protein
MCAAFPRSDYYGPSVPLRGHQQTACLPAAANTGGEGGHETVPTFITGPLDGVGAQLCPCNIATSTPQTFLVASPPTALIGFGVAARERPRAACAANRPISTRLEPA